MFSRLVIVTIPCTSPVHWLLTLFLSSVLHMSLFFHTGLLFVRTLSVAVATTWGSQFECGCSPTLKTHVQCGSCLHVNIALFSDRRTRSRSNCTTGRVAHPTSQNVVALVVVSSWHLLQRGLAVTPADWLQFPGLRELSVFLSNVIMARLSKTSAILFH